MWKVHIFMFIVTLLVSILWAHIISNDDNNYDEEDEMF